MIGSFVSMFLVCLLFSFALRNMDLDVEIGGTKGWPSDASVVFYHRAQVRKLDSIFLFLSFCDSHHVSRD